jgi:hypothetical protein
MNPEYIRFTNNEKIEIEKHMLKSQLLLLDSLKRYKIYRKLRTEELLLKISLKTKIDHLVNDLKFIDRSLPKPTIKPKGIDLVEEEKKLSLEQEIDYIKRKLENLSNK